MKFKGILLTILSLLFTAQVNAQEVQDTFMGMKLGTKLTDAAISANVGTRGTYSRIDNMVTYTSMRFSNTLFAGHKWYSAYFYRDKDKVFYEFKVSDLFDSFSNQEALKDFRLWREKLNSKYTPTELEGKNGVNNLAYHGDNGVIILLSLEYLKSTLDVYHYYVTIEYIKEDLYNSVMEATNDEL